MDERVINVEIYDARGNGEGGVSYTLNTIDHHAVCYEISAGEACKGKDDVCQTLRSRMGTGGGQHADSAYCFRKSTKSAKNGKGDKWTEDTVTNTINTFENTAVRTAEIIVEVIR